ncbi:MAG: TIGR03643 family protein [Maribacter sp.]|nr:TIGR03643 family protein [Maribacter sp.]
MSHKHLSSLPIYRKALELCHMSREIASYVSFNKDLLKLYTSQSLRDIIAEALLTDSILIPQQIANAEYSKSRSERLKSATYINIMIRNINSYCRGLEYDGVREKEYINLLRREIKNFRKSFKEWRKSIIDSRDGSWGLNEAPSGI